MSIHLPSTDTGVVRPQSLSRIVLSTRREESDGKNGEKEGSRAEAEDHEAKKK